MESTVNQANPTPPDSEEPPVPSVQLGPPNQDNPLFNSGQLDFVMKAARVFAASKLVPAHCQGSPETCAILIGTAMRLHLDPFMFMQNCYVVGGRPGMNGQLLIAMINASGLFSPLNWRFDGAGTDNYRCVCTATRKSSGESCETAVSWKMIKAEGWDRNPKWHSMPEQMFCYRSAAFFARRHCPEVLIGFMTNDELDDVVETTSHSIPPAPIDPDEPAPQTKTSTAETGRPPSPTPAATDAEGPTSAPAPLSEAEAPSASTPMPEAWETKGNDPGAAVISSAEGSQFWPAYRRRHDRDEKPLRRWLAEHHYTSSKEVAKKDFEAMMKDLT